MSFRALPLGISVALTPFLAGCPGKHAAGAADAGAKITTVASLAPEQAAQVLAKVGDHTITLGEFAATLEHLDAFDRLRYQSPERRRELLDEMIDVELLADEAIARGYDKDPVAEEERRAILRDAFFAEVHKGAPAPADIPASDVEAYFNAHKADYHDPERRRLSLLVFKDEKAALATLDAAKVADARSWGELVRQRSIDAQAKANVPPDLAGDVGLVSPPGDPRGANSRIPEGVRVAAFALAKPGDVSPAPIKADGKAYLVRLTQIQEARDRSFAEAERTIRIKLAEDRARAREEEALAALRVAYPVKIDDEALARVQVDLADGGGPPAGPKSDGGNK